MGLLGRVAGLRPFPHQQRPFPHQNFGRLLLIDSAWHSPGDEELVEEFFCVEHRVALIARRDQVGAETKQVSVLIEIQAVCVYGEERRLQEDTRLVMRPQKFFDHAAQTSRDNNNRNAFADACVEQLHRTRPR